MRGKNKEIWSRVAMNTNSPVCAARPGVLIVDDSLTVRMDLRETFDCAGLANQQCETLAAARAALAEQPFSLVVLDMLLPDGDGLDLLRQIKGVAGRSLPVMLLSSEAEVYDRVRGLKTGADEYIGKPYDRSYVLARARQLIGRDERQPEDIRPSLLLIDDSVPFREEFQRTLEVAGYRVETAWNGEEGLNTAFALRPDAIIVDFLLPGSMDGAMVIHRAKQDVTLRHTPCLLLTGSARAGDEPRVLEAGADAYLTKETDVDVILARLAALVRSGRPPRLVDSPASSLLGAKKILAVGESVAFRNELAAELRSEGYDIMQADSGEEALELLEVQEVHCILMDVQMPGLSGYETCRIIKSRPALRNIPLLLLTATGDPDAVVVSINAGADDCVQESSDFALLKARVHVQLRRKQFEDEERIIREELLRKEMVAVEARSAQEIAETRAAMVDGLEQKNRELEAFAYAVSHDLRSPLRAIRGFTQALLDDFGAQLPARAQDDLGRVMAGALGMSKLIDTLLELSRTNRAALSREAVDLSSLAWSIAAELAESDRGRHVDCSVQPGLTACGDTALIGVVLHNLLDNAWKFTGKIANAKIQVGAFNGDGGPVYFVRDNGAGFDNTCAKRLFQPFQRLHAATDFQGAGIGLATVRRIVERHRGEIWAESAVGAGATFFFTLDGRGPLGIGSPDIRPAWKLGSGR